MPPPSPESVGLAQRFYALSPETGSFERITITRMPLTGVDPALRTLSQETSTFIKCFSTLSNGSAVHANITASMLTMAIRLPQLRLATYFQVVPPLAGPPAQPAAIVPVFRPDAGVPGAPSTGLRLAPMWTPPPNMAIFYTCHFEKDSPDNFFFARASLLCICIDKAQPGTFKLPLPNTYANGKLCLGSDGSLVRPAPYKDPLMLSVQKAVDVFMSSSWNGDMLTDNNMQVIHRMFRFNTDDATTQVAPPTDWAPSFMKINNPDFGSIPFHSLL